LTLIQTSRDAVAVWLAALTLRLSALQLQLRPR